MTDRYRAQWEENAQWLKLSFHSRLKNVRPYELSGYEEVYGDGQQVHREILRFAGPASLGKTTTIHYCRTTLEGLAAIKDLGIQGLLGLFGTDETPRVSYCVPEEKGFLLRRGSVENHEGVQIGGIDMVISLVPLDRVTPELAAQLPREQLRVMIHEQHFYPDYSHYQPDLEKKLAAAFALFEKEGFESRFFDEMI